MIVTMKNKYIYRSRISEKKFRQILKFFCLDLEAKKVAEICNISEKTTDKIFKAIRIKMVESCEKMTKLSGEIEIDESYFLKKHFCFAKSTTLVLVQKECVVGVVVELVVKHLYSDF